MKKLLILALFICHLGYAERIMVYSGKSEGVSFQFFNFTEIKHKNYFGGHQLHSGFLLVKGIKGLEGHWGHSRYGKHKKSVIMSAYALGSLKVIVDFDGDGIETTIKYGTKSYVFSDCKSENSGLEYTSYKSKYDDVVDLGSFIISNEKIPMTVPTAIYVLKGEKAGRDKRLVHILRDIGHPIRGRFPSGGVLYRKGDKFQDREGGLVLYPKSKTFSLVGYDKKKKTLKLNELERE